MNLQIDFAPLCSNKCASCISRQHHLFRGKSVSVMEWYRQLCKAARTANSATISGYGEPFFDLENNPYLPAIREMMAETDLKQLDVCTSGTDITASRLNRFKRAGATRISLSLFSLDSERDALFKGTRNMEWNIRKTCKLIKDMGFPLRIELLLSLEFEGYYQEELIDYAKRLGADQLTLKVIQSLDSGYTGSQFTRWAREFRLSNEWLTVLVTGIRKGTIPLIRPEDYPDGFQKNSGGLSFRVDTSCMDGNREVGGLPRYMVFRKDGRLYSSWEAQPC